MSSVARDRVGLAELVALLSLGTDLGLGQPMEHMIRACLIALRMGERLGLTESERGVVYYSGLLAWVGCHTDAYEQAKWLGDDLTLKIDYAQKTPGAYPLILVTYEIVCTKYSDSAKAALVKSFLNYTVGAGQDTLAQEGYAPLPTELQTKVKASLAKVS